MSLWAIGGPAASCSAHFRVATLTRPFDFYATQAEAALLLRPVDQFGLMVGYKDWRHDHDDSNIAGIDKVDLEVDGWFIGMELRY